MATSERPGGPGAAGSSPEDVAASEGWSLQPNQAPAHHALLARPQFWLAVGLVGVAAGLGADLLVLLLRAVQHRAFGYRSGSFQTAVIASGDVRRVVVLVLAGVVGGTGWYLLRRTTSGSGDVASALWTRSGRLPALLSLANAVLSIVVVGMGASLGREAAPQQVGGVAAGVAGGRLGLTLDERRLLIACGAAAGMGAVYDVPLGAALFATEVLLGTITLPTVVPAIATTSLATAVAWIGLPDRPLYDSPPLHVTGSLLAWAVIAGPVLGVAAAGWTRAIRWTTDHRTSGWRLLVVPVVVLGLLGLLATRYPQLLGNGRSLVQDTLDQPRALGLLAALVLLKPLVTAACLRSGLSGGLFTPTMSIGALLGALLGRAWGHLWAGASEASFATVGAGALLAAAMQGPLAASVLIVELVRQSDALLVPVLVAAVGATVTVRALGSESIYSARIRL